MALPDVRRVLEFLRCRTPPAWVEAALADRPTLLRDHAALELKAAQQAQRLIWKYGMRAPGRHAWLSRTGQASLRAKLSRLAREELRHFEQVLALLQRRGIAFEPVSASRYAAALHGVIAAGEPACFVDTLIVCAVIEARSCERFYSLLAPLAAPDPELARFYRSLLRSEARHFDDYLALARAAAPAPIGARIDELLELDAGLVAGPDTELRFHSGAAPA